MKKFYSAFIGVFIVGCFWVLLQGPTSKQAVIEPSAAENALTPSNKHAIQPVAAVAQDTKIATQQENVVAASKVITPPNISDPATQGEIDSYFGGLLWGAAYGVQGSGLVIGQFEAAGFPDPNNAFLTGRVQEINRSVTGPVSGFDNGHATPVALRLIGNGTDDNRGIAPQASIEAYRIQNPDGTISYVEADLANRLADGTKPLMLVSNHSYASRAGWKDPAFNWGDYNWWSVVDVSKIKEFKFGKYSARDEDFDRISVNHPNHTIVTASGNNRNFGASYSNAIAFKLPFTTPYDYNLNNEPQLPEIQNYDCIPWGGLGKNVITVGAANTIAGGYAHRSDAQVFVNSSIGPTDDGRIKPDLVAPSSFKTSGAAPQVAGSALLLQELHHKNYGTYLTSASIKALLIQTAFETGAGPAPDYEYGWGMLNPTAAADVILRKVLGAQLQEGSLADGATATRYIYLDGTKPFKATVAWIDPEGIALPVTYVPTDLDNRTPQLVNDLDVRLAPMSNPTAVVLPWKLDVNNPSAAATQADNTVDNVEQVYAASPVAGWYTLTITHKGTLKDNAPQPYSLVYSGAADLHCDAVLDATAPLVWEGGSWTPTFTNGQNVQIRANVTFAGNSSVRDLIAEGVTIDLQSDLEVTGQLLLAPNTVFTGPGKLILKGTQSICGGTIRHLEFDGTSANLTGGPVNVTELATLTAGTVTTQNGNLVLKGAATDQKSYAQLENDGGTLTGAITVESYAIGGTRGWRHIGFPVTTTVADIANDYKIFTLNPAASAVNFWNATVGNWEAPAALTTSLNANTPLAIFVGRRLSDNAQFTEMPHRIKITGTPHNGAVNNAIVYGAAAPSPDNQQGWNFIANPYPQNLDWNVIETRIPADLNKAYYVLDGGAGIDQYKTYVGGVGDAGRYISPMQAFFVKANSALAESTTAFNFTNGDRTSTKGDFRKNSTEHLILNVSDGVVSDRLYFAFRDSASFGFDGAFDAYKLRAAGSNAPLLYHPTNNQQLDLSIQSVPRGLRRYQFDVRFESPESKVFSLDVTQMNLPEDAYLILEDRKTSQRMAPFKSTYNFQHTGGSRDFVLTMYSSKTEAEAGNNAHVWLNSGLLQISLLEAEKIQDISVFNLAGQLLFQTKNLEGAQHKLPAQWPPRSGVCVVVLTFEDRVERHKIFVQ